MTDCSRILLPPGGDLSADRLESYHYQALAYDIPSHMDQVADDLLDLLDVVRSFALQEVILPTDAHCRETVAGLRATAERFREAARATSHQPHEAQVLAYRASTWDE
jgi:hypothetical protein